MTTLYRPIRIETAEQAEALPDGTMAHGRFWDGDEEPMGAIRVDGGWELTGYERPGREANSTVTGWTALVPIEAEEQHITAKLMKDPTHPDGMRAFLTGETPADMTRLVTPWEEA